MELQWRRFYRQTSSLGRQHKERRAGRRGGTGGNRSEPVCKGQRGRTAGRGRARWPEHRETARGAARRGPARGQWQRAMQPATLQGEDRARGRPSSATADTGQRATSAQADRASGDDPPSAGRKEEPSRPWGAAATGDSQERLGAFPRLARGPTQLPASTLAPLDAAARTAQVRPGLALPVLSRARPRPVLHQHPVFTHPAAPGLPRAQQDRRGPGP